MAATTNAKCLDVQSLLACSILKILERLPAYMSHVESLPINIKQRLLQLMCKRGMVTDANITEVLQKNATSLELNECDVSDAALFSIASKCPALRKIDVNACKANRTDITDAGICELASKCKFLQIVYMRRCTSITDGSVIALSTCCPMLREINLKGCPLITDAALEVMGQHCRHLVCVDFSYSQVTDNGVFSLVNGVCSSHIKELHMASCVHITDDAVEAVVMSCPKIAILLIHGCPKLTDRSREAMEEVLSHSSKMKQVTWTVY